MGGMKDTLGDTPFYPNAPGFKEPTTSRAAARKMRGEAATLRDRAHGALLAAGAEGMTADEVAAQLRETVLAIRPRITELAKETPPRAAKTDKRRTNKSGMSAIVWRAA